MEGLYIPTFNKTQASMGLVGQLMDVAENTDKQMAKMHGEYMVLLRSLKSGEISLSALEVGENGFSVLPLEPKENANNGKKEEGVPTKV